MRTLALVSSLIVFMSVAACSDSSSSGNAVSKGGAESPAKPSECGDKHPDFSCGSKLVSATLVTLAKDAPSWKWFLEANDLPANTNPESVVPAGSWYYIGIKKEFKLGHPSCESYKTQKEAGVYCSALNEPGTYGEIAGRDFEWFKKMNNLPNNITRDTSAPTYTWYVEGLRRSK